MWEDWDYDPARLVPGLRMKKCESYTGAKWVECTLASAVWEAHIGRTSVVLSGGSTWYLGRQYTCHWRIWVEPEVCEWAEHFELEP